MGNTNEFHIVCAGTAGLDLMDRQFLFYIEINDKKIGSQWRKKIEEYYYKQDI